MRRASRYIAVQDLGLVRAPAQNRMVTALHRPFAVLRDTGDSLGTQGKISGSPYLIAATTPQCLQVWPP